MMMISMMMIALDGTSSSPQFQRQHAPQRYRAAGCFVLTTTLLGSGSTSGESVTIEGGTGNHEHGGKVSISAAAA